MTKHAAACLAPTLRPPKRISGLLLSLLFARLPNPNASLLIHSPAISQVIGCYALTPAAAMTASGSYTAPLSIRSGKSSCSHDRVFRFIPLFRSPAAAIRYAIEQWQKLFAPARPARLTTELAALHTQRPTRTRALCTL